jgi:hypothetical protein
MFREWYVIAVVVAFTGACTRDTERARVTASADYAVYAVAIDSLVLQTNEPRDLILLTPTVGDGPEGMASVEAMRDDADVPDDVRADFMAKNRLRVPLRAESLALGIPFRVLPRDSVTALAERGRDLALTSREGARRDVVHVSRVGFSRDSSRALLYLGHSCGDLCGTGWRVQFRRDAERRWRIVTADAVWMT